MARLKHSNEIFPYLIGAAAVAAVLIALGAPLASLAPFAIVLACPLMMFVMMRGMGAMHGPDDHSGPVQARTRKRGASCTTETGTTPGAAEPGGRWRS